MSPRVFATLAVVIQVIGWTFCTAHPVFARQINEPGNESRAQSDLFETNIRPLLIEKCYDCHSIEAGESSGKLRLDDREAMRRGGIGGPAVVAGSIEDSLLVRAIRYDDPDMQMPPDGKLDDSQIQLLEAWIASGAYDPRDPENDAHLEKPTIDPRQHWTFQSPTLAAPPRVNSTTSLDVLDAVVAQRLSDHDLDPAPAADKATLLRRLSYDLTGLPPSAELAQTYLASDRSDAYDRLVDSLLATPEFGERLARHWMDVARYADTVGYALGGQERRLRGSERYRDWLIKNFNSDLAYDEMIKFQLAADVFDPDGSQGHLDAMGYLTIGRRYLGGPDIVDDRIDVVTRGLLGLTVSCARCHDHKFDPIPTADYYALYGVFNSSKQEDAADSPWPLRMTDHNVHDVHVFVRGQQGNRGPIAPRAFLSILEDGQPEPFTEGSGRKELAERIADGDNPLTARVFVNRIWSWLVGKSLVDSPSDFGVRTEPPLHPEVLDDLATDFVQHQWSIKYLVRRIVLTHIYRQTSSADREATTADPENRWLARGNRGRLDLESLRDSYLVASNRIDRRLGGDPVDILSNPTPPRRTVYAFIDRQQLPGVFRVFDLASPDAHTPERYRTTVPQQSLFLLNSPFAMQAATDLVERAERESSSDEALIDSMFSLALHRPATTSERKLGLDFISQPSTIEPVIPDPRSQWSYGKGAIGDDGLLTNFQPFPVFRDGRYQGGDQLPDPVWGHTFQSADGGHPGPGREWATVRRWTADQDGHAAISIRVRHPENKGDGIRATVAGPDEKYWQDIIKADNRKLDVIKKSPLLAGQSIDFIVDDNGTTSFDSFRFNVSIRFVAGDVVKIFNSKTDFVSPEQLNKPQQSLSRKEQFAQVLLMSNEFVFVD